MKQAISRIVDQYDSGKISRRELVAGLAGAVVLGANTTAVASAADDESTFQAVGLHHVALGVTDVARSRDFYIRHLGLELSSESLPHQSFLDCGPNFVALFRSSTPGMHHYSYAIPDYNQQNAAERLRAADLQPSLQGGRIYFDDPDGLVVQVSQAR